MLEICGEDSGCAEYERPGLFGGDEVGNQYVAGPGCVSRSGYSGYRISVEEMRGCRAVQCLMRKEEGWVEEEEYQDFEGESGYFLTGLGDGSPDETPLEDISPVGHAIADVWISNVDLGNGSVSSSVHP